MQFVLFESQEFVLGGEFFGLVIRI